MITEHKKQYNRQYYCDNKERIDNWKKAYIRKNWSKYRQKNIQRRGLYNSWSAMKSRCNRVNHKQYKDYGGRGIIYHPRWETFEGFKLDMIKSYKKGLTLDRIDVNGNYVPENCRWISRKEQNNNKRKHIMVNFKGEKITLSQYAEKMGLNFGSLRSRYYRGMPMEKVMSKNF